MTLLGSRYIGYTDLRLPQSQEYEITCLPDRWFPKRKSDDPMYGVGICNGCHFTLESIASLYVFTLTNSMNEWVTGRPIPHWLLPKGPYTVSRMHVGRASLARIEKHCADVELMSTN